CTFGCMSETIPPNWWRDQYDAASRDNFRHTIRAAMIDAAMSPHYGIAVPSGTSFWERERQRIIRAWSAGEMRSCTHNPSPGAPQPVYVFLWRPDLIVCQRCTMIANALSEI